MELHGESHSPPKKSHAKSATRKFLSRESLEVYSINEVEKMDPNTLVNMFSNCKASHSTTKRYKMYRCELLGSDCIHTFAGRNDEDCRKEMASHIMGHIRTLLGKSKKDKNRSQKSNGKSSKKDRHKSKNEDNVYEEKRQSPKQKFNKNKATKYLIESGNFSNQIGVDVVGGPEVTADPGSNFGTKEALFSAMGLERTSDSLLNKNNSRTMNTRTRAKEKIANNKLKRAMPYPQNIDIMQTSSGTSKALMPTAKKSENFLNKVLSDSPSMVVANTKYNFRKVMNKHVKSSTRVENNTLYQKNDIVDDENTEPNAKYEPVSKIVELPPVKNPPVEESQNIFEKLMDVKPDVSNINYGIKQKSVVSMPISSIIARSHIKKAKRRFLLNNKRDQLLGKSFRTEKLKAIKQEALDEFNPYPIAKYIAENEENSMDIGEGEDDMLDLNTNTETENEQQQLQAVQNDHSYCYNGKSKPHIRDDYDSYDEESGSKLPDYAELLNKVQEVKNDPLITREDAKTKLKAVQLLMQYLRSGVSVKVDDHEKGTKAFNCEICEKKFASAEVLQRHVKAHAGLLLKPYKCHVCGKAFTRQHSLKYHVMVHTNSTRFKCEFCGKGFRHPSHFREHQNSHTGEEPYECSVCSLTFKTSNTHRRHMKNKHSMGVNRKKMSPRYLSPVTVKMDGETPVLLIQSYNPTTTPNKDNFIHPILKAETEPIKVKLMPMNAYYEITLKKVEINDEETDSISDNTEETVSNSSTFTLTDNQIMKDSSSDNILQNSSAFVPIISKDAFSTKEENQSILCDQSESVNKKLEESPETLLNIVNLINKVQKEEKKKENEVLSNENITPYSDKGLTKDVKEDEKIVVDNVSHAESKTSADIRCSTLALPSLSSSGLPVFSPVKVTTDATVHKDIITHSIALTNLTFSTIVTPKSSITLVSTVQNKSTPQVQKDTEIAGKKFDTNLTYSTILTPKSSIITLVSSGNIKNKSVSPLVRKDTEVTGQKDCFLSRNTDMGKFTENAYPMFDDMDMLGESAKNKNLLLNDCHMNGEKTGIAIVNDKKVLMSKEILNTEKNHNAILTAEDVERSIFQSSLLRLDEEEMGIDFYNNTVSNTKTVDIGNTIAMEPVFANETAINME